MASIWLVIFIVLVIIELLTINLVTIWFAIATVFALLVDIITKNVMLEIIVFTVSSFLLLLLTKPLIGKIKVKRVEATNLDMVINKVGIVTVDILNDKIGEVKVLGKKWSAYSDSEIKKNEKVKILSIDGVKLRVEKIGE
mgnify:CR=1 FL=1